MKITIRDVAKRAGVSHTTVSLVMNNDPRITSETREKVLKAVKEMNFHPDADARGLARGNSNVISVVSVMLVSPFISGVVEGIETQAYDLDRYEYSIEPHSTRKSPEMKKNMLEEILYGKQARAIILIGLNPPEAIVKDFREKNVPIILVEYKVKGAHSVRVDNFSGAYKATEYLIKKGKKRIGLITADLSPMFEDVEVYTSPAERYDGYIRALKDYGIKHDPALVMPAHSFSYEEGKEALNGYLDRGLKPDAVFCSAGDTTALGFMEQAMARGMNIPGDISVIGYDDLVFSKLVKPALTTVRQPITLMGREAFDIAIAAIEGDLKTDRDVVFGPELIVRESA